MQTKGDRTRQHILSAASRLFELKGFRGTSLTDLQTATDLKKGALYFHFQSKDEIGLAVLAASRAEFGGLLDRALVGTTPVESLDAFFAAILKWQVEMEFCGGCIFGNIALEMGDTDPRFAAFVDQVFDEWIVRIGSVIAEGQQQGQITSGVPSKALARHVVASIEGGIMLSRLKKDEEPLRDCLDALSSVLGLVRD